MKKFPEGATHTYSGPSGESYRKKILDKWHAYIDGDWFPIGVHDSECYEIILAEPEWAGEGLPPAGIECEYLEGGNADWERVTVIAIDHRHGFQYAVFHGDKGYSGDRRSELFRPIPTAKQVAAEKRDAAIKEMQRLVGSCNTFPFADLYDYGYRLQVEK